MKKHGFLPISVLAILAAATVSASAPDEARTAAPIAADQTKTVLTIRRVPDGNGSKVMAATMQVRVEFDREFFCSVNIEGRTLLARGSVHRGSNQILRVQLEFSDEREGAVYSFKNTFLTQLGERHTLVGLPDSGAIEAFVATQDKPGK